MQISYLKCNNLLLKLAVQMVCNLNAFADALLSHFMD